jgi:8-oxo-dGTP pyrophosphatase MutT (NUDIX family)
MKPFKLVGIQYAALPYRIEGRQAQILLITSRRTRRWIIPKGWPMNGLRPQEAAAAEAAEEAGLAGEIADRPIGSYNYLKQRKGDQTLAIQVLVFPFRVDGFADSFKEQGQRRAQWFRYQDAAARVAEPALRGLIREFGASAETPNFLMRHLRRYRTWRFGRGPVAVV